MSTQGTVLSQRRFLKPDRHSVEVWICQGLCWNPLVLSTTFCYPGSFTAAITWLCPLLFNQSLSPIYSYIWVNPAKPFSNNYHPTIMINMTEVVNISYMFTVCQNEQSAFTCIAPFNSLNLRDKLSYYPHCPYSLLHSSKVTQQVFLVPKPLSPFYFPGFCVYLLVLLSHLSMRDCCLKSQSWGVTSASCWQIIERSQKLSNPSSIQSRHHSPVHKSIKNLLWQSKSDLLNLAFNNHLMWPSLSS